MKFLLKSFLYLGIVAGGAYLAVNHIPSLKANILEVVNPRVKETRLLGELQQNLSVLNTQLSPSVGTAVSGGVSVGKAAAKAIVGRAQALVSQINDINTGHAGLVQNSIATLVNALTSQLSPSATPTPAPPPCVAK